ncbi:related to acetylxylan esterase [Cephalotrichum gorgonifer]|uniref:Related to acetylxylan esterase n=1 Tax=Cephalotrichum gorgonifer TaxID=2041049 RepID=A0AAE8SSY5_9PEZI|nr:related to acetylxylan esterase [Cephalotrichum gorgonifer]
MRGLTILSALAAVASAQKVKVLPLGDSITDICCWRGFAWAEIAKAGLADQVDFVGSMTGIQGRCNAPSGFDPNHEGHSGWQAYDIARDNIAGWMQQSKPDVVSVLLGTNDINIGKRDATTIINAYTSLLTSMRTANPNVAVVMSTIIPMRWDDATAAAVNKQLPAWVQQHNTTQSPIYFADISRTTGFTTDMLQGDGVHPTIQGDQIISNHLAPLIIEAVTQLK